MKRPKFHVYLRVLLLPSMLAALLAPGLIGTGSDVAAQAMGQLPARAPLAGITSDDFNACELNGELWTELYRPTKYRYELRGAFTGDAHLAMIVPSGSKHTISESNTSALRALQPAPNTDFEVVAKFTSRLTQAIQIQGILVQGAGSNEYLRFEFYYDGSKTHFYTAVLANGNLTTYHNWLVDGPTATQDYYIRVKRVGNDWTHTFSYDGVTWLPPATIWPGFTYATTVAAIGVYAGNSGSNPSLTALADYFFNWQSPITPEDGGQNALNLTTVGLGTAVKNPDKASYACDEQVELTATPAEHWAFGGWSGDLRAGEDPNANPLQVVMKADRNMTANFVAEEHVLTINRVGNGQVNQVPDPPYYYNDQVTLTAVPDPGWAFKEWSGDLSGTVGEAILNMTKDMTVTATFEEGAYFLSIDEGQHGTVGIDPWKPAGYAYEEEVELTPNPATGFQFGDWGGPDGDDVYYPGAGQTWRLIMDGNKSIVAQWNAIPYTVAVSVLGDGEVRLTPSQTTYQYGDVVTFTAAPGRGYAFDGWSGDLTGLENPKIVTITGDMLVTARFVARPVSYFFLPVVLKGY